MQALKGRSMEKWLCWGAMGTAGVLGLMFVLDLFTGMPFGGPKAGFLLIDVVGILGCCIVGYLGWDAFQDYR